MKKPQTKIEVNGLYDNRLRESKTV